MWSNGQGVAFQGLSPVAAPCMSHFGTHIFSGVMKLLLLYKDSLRICLVYNFKGALYSIMNIFPNNIPCSFYHIYAIYKYMYNIYNTYSVYYLYSIYNIYNYIYIYINFMQTCPDHLHLYITSNILPVFFLLISISRFCDGLLNST